ncbi:hypothetical protein M407DRAFT_27291 [Tulasnella calospora MUT 4182]|uniref:Uncharacterized protein n=1 Tax=Tulasnella calospora MUT 4182 TaxID=1051891 RepID=A0A0C3Q3F0_9AGAM|nr:hypothetical protein M407DRAFT_27291 [Tulasnella calospora MUT 4182]
MSPNSKSNMLAACIQSSTTTKNRDTGDLIQLLEQDEVRRANSVSSTPKATSTPQPRKSSILAMLILQRDDAQDHETNSEPSVESDSTAVRSASASSVLSSLKRRPKRHKAVHKTSIIPETLFSLEAGEILASQLRTLMKGKKRLSAEALQKLSDDLGKLEGATTRLERKYLEDTGLALAVHSLSSLPGLELPMRDKYKWVKRTKVLSRHWSSIL